MSCPNRIPQDPKYCLHYIQPGLCSLGKLESLDKLLCIDWWPESTSYSGMSEFSHCRRSYYWEYVEKYESVDEPIPVKKGKIGHEILRYIHNKENNPELGFIRFIIDEHHEDKINKDLLALQGIMEGYLEDEKFSSMKGQPEYEWRYEEPNMPKLHGFIDLIQYSDDAGPRIGYEFKFTGNPKAFMEKQQVELQLGCYFLGVPSLQRMVLRIIQFPELRLGKNEEIKDFKDRTKEDFKKRPRHYINDVQYWRNEFDLEAIKEEAKRIVKDIRLYQKEGIKGYFKNVLACYWPSQCSYLPLCLNNFNVDQIPENLYRKKVKYVVSKT